MARYIVGDIHGCLQPLQNLLKQVDFSPRVDELWAVGDLIGRGPDAQATLEFLAELGPSFRCVLGNHDLHALAVFTEVKAVNPKDNTHDIARSADRDYWINWLRQQPLFVADATNCIAMVHAGIHPQWSIDQAAEYAHEVELYLQSRQYVQLLEQMYGNSPESWSNDLAGFERLRGIINICTRMRYLTADGHIDLAHKEPLAAARELGLKPWYQDIAIHPWQLAFGHWASLQGEADHPQVLALDTGCVWGEQLTLWDCEQQKKISVPGWQR
ncbi:MAG: symmetrical bis(5'-nucleosyl)-tetraphosphatase [Gammaproteobacteria bacterium]|nr:symmetrical bis(5'-nucleosyl)-tetraphosphatase [Gammaproteobacteria bacterium]